MKLQQCTYMGHRIGWRWQFGEGGKWHYWLTDRKTGKVIRKVKRARQQRGEDFALTQEDR